MATSGDNPGAAWTDLETTEFLILQKSTNPNLAKTMRAVSALTPAMTIAECKPADEPTFRSTRFPSLVSSAAILRNRVGLIPSKVVETLKNSALTSAVLTLSETVRDGSVMPVVVTAAAKIPAPQLERFSNLLANLIDSKQIRQINLDAVSKYLKRVQPGQELNDAEFRSECGIGVVVTREDVAREIGEIVGKVREEVKSAGWRNFDVNGLFKTVRNSPALKWADNREVKDEFDSAILSILGPKSTSPDPSPKPSASPITPSASPSSRMPAVKQHDHGLRLPAPKDNHQLRPEILQAHLSRTGGRVITRFPPEPNGFLHIGHAKSMYLNFGLASRDGGLCFLRLDDTNPERENHQYIESIIDNVAWLGHTPCKVTYASQYFDRIKDCAVELIKRGKAYVCHQSSKEIQECRKCRQPSPWRDRPVQENLELFEQMAQGRFGEGEATLRMKIDITSVNPCMWDPVAYRVKFVPHPMTGNKYCIYPSYDWTHCLCDSFEDITHSLCTLEFLPRRESYYWELDALEVYKPIVWEFGRLNIEHTVMSKRKLLSLVKDGLVRGWDDPRLPTINGLRRRGYSPAAINNFCDAVSVTTNTTVFQEYGVLEQCCRQDMETRCRRAMGVLRPLLVELTNMPESTCLEVERPNHPTDPKRGTNVVHLTKRLYIDASDFRIEDQRDYWGLAPGKAVGLRYASAITCDSVVMGPDGKTPEKLLCTYDTDRKLKPKGLLHWVAQPSPGVEPKRVEVRLYEPLFRSKRPDEIDCSEDKEAWKKDLNSDTETIVRDALFDETLLAPGVKPGEAVQLERVGFFCCDPDSTPDRPVWVRTVSLKQSKEKKTL